MIDVVVFVVSRYYVIGVLLGLLPFVVLDLAGRGVGVVAALGQGAVEAFFVFFLLAGLDVSVDFEVTVSTQFAFLSVTSRFVKWVIFVISQNSVPPSRIRLLIQVRHELHLRTLTEPQPAFHHLLG